VKKGLLCFLPIYFFFYVFGIIFWLLINKIRLTEGKTKETMVVVVVVVVSIVVVIGVAAESQN